jgi:hypothetical protein
MAPSLRHRSRRRQRSVRVSVAVLLLGLATALVLVALSVRTVPLLSAASVVALLSGGAAARIIYSELRETWRTHARDRARQAQAFRGLFVERAAQHAAFSSAMAERLGDSEREVRELEATLRLSEGRAVDAEDRVRREARRGEEARARVAELEVALAIRTAEEADELASWEMDREDHRDVDTVVDLLAWEERGSRTDTTAQRRHA